MLARLDLERTHRFEARLTERFSRVLVNSQADRDHLANIATNDVDSIRIVRSGVDVEHFHPSPRRRDPATVVFVGRMSYHANIAAVRRLLEEIVPRIWRQRPDVRVIIVGERPPRSLKALARSLGPRVELTGYVPDVREFLASATITVAPLVYAVGMQNKILEAMATETPVVCSLPALGGLQAVPGRDLVAAESDDDIAQQALQLLSDDARREALGRAGRRCVAEHHSWSAAGDQLETIYRELVAGKTVETA
jgi:glycosyltransferase involved in cell wall biosynthesis